MLLLQRRAPYFGSRREIPVSKLIHFYSASIPQTTNEETVIAGFKCPECGVEFKERKKHTRHVRDKRCRSRRPPPADDLPPPPVDNLPPPPVDDLPERIPPEEQSYSPGPLGPGIPEYRPTLGLVVVRYEEEGADLRDEEEGADMRDEEEGASMIVEEEEVGSDSVKGKEEVGGVARKEEEGVEEADRHWKLGFNPLEEFNELWSEEEEKRFKREEEERRRVEERERELSFVEWQEEEMETWREAEKETQERDEAKEEELMIIETEFAELKLEVEEEWESSKEEILRKDWKDMEGDWKARRDEVRAKEATLRAKVNRLMEVGFCQKRALGKLQGEGREVMQEKVIEYEKKIGELLRDLDRWCLKLKGCKNYELVFGQGPYQEAHLMAKFPGNEQWPQYTNKEVDTMFKQIARKLKKRRINRKKRMQARAKKDGPGKLRLKQPLHNDAAAEQQEKRTVFLKKQPKKRTVTLQEAPIPSQEITAAKTQVEPRRIVFLEELPRDREEAAYIPQAKRRRTRTRTPMAKEEATFGLQASSTPQDQEEAASRPKVRRGQKKTKTSPPQAVKPQGEKPSVQLEETPLPPVDETIPGISETELVDACRWAVEQTVSGEGEQGKQDQSNSGTEYPWLQKKTRPSKLPTTKNKKKKVFISI